MFHNDKTYEVGQLRSLILKNLKMPVKQIKLVKESRKPTGKLFPIVKCVYNSNSNQHHLESDDIVPKLMGEVDQYREGEGKESKESKGSKESNGSKESKNTKPTSTAVSGHTCDEYYGSSIEVEIDVKDKQSKWKKKICEESSACMNEYSKDNFSEVFASLLSLLPYSVDETNGLLTHKFGLESELIISDSQARIERFKENENLSKILDTDEERHQRHTKLSQCTQISPNMNNNSFNTKEKLLNKKIRIVHNRSVYKSSTSMKNECKKLVEGDNNAPVKQFIKKEDNAKVIQSFFRKKKISKQNKNNLKLITTWDDSQKFLISIFIPNGQDEEVSLLLFKVYSLLDGETFYHQANISEIYEIYSKIKRDSLNAKLIAKLVKVANKKIEIEKVFTSRVQMLSPPLQVPSSQNFSIKKSNPSSQTKSEKSEEESMDFDISFRSIHTNSMDEEDF